MTVIMHQYDRNTKGQSKQWRHSESPLRKKSCVMSHLRKVMHKASLDQIGVMMMDCLAKDTTITGTYYTSLLQILRETIKTKRPAMLTKGVCLL